MPRRGRWPISVELISAIGGGEKRLTKLAAAMADAPSQSLPKQCGSWGDLKAAYRLLSHPRIRPEQITAAHRQHTRERAQQEPVVLCVQDTTDLDYTHRTAVRGLGKIGDGRAGVGFIAGTSAAPIVPAYITGSRALGQAFRRRPPVTVAYGEPIAPGKAETSEDYRALTDRIMEGIRALKSEVEGR